MSNTYSNHEEWPWVLFIPHILYSGPSSIWRGTSTQPLHNNRSIITGWTGRVGNFLTLVHHAHDLNNPSWFKPTSLWIISLTKFISPKWGGFYVFLCVPAASSAADAHRSWARVFPFHRLYMREEQNRPVVCVCVYIIGFSFSHYPSAHSYSKVPHGICSVLVFICLCLCTQHLWDSVRQTPKHQLADWSDFSRLTRMM